MDSRRQQRACCNPGSPRSDRFYSMSTAIMAERKNYYRMLNLVQHSDGDVTAWIVWFLSCLKTALLSAESKLAVVFNKADFRAKHEQLALNARQHVMLHRLLDGFEGKLTSSKWAKITKVSQDSANRDIADLIRKGVLVPDEGGVRSTAYRLVM